MINPGLVVAILAFILLGTTLKPGMSFAQESITPISIVPGAGSLGENAFNPPMVEVKAGDTVAWRNDDSAIHAISAYDEHYVSGNYGNYWPQFVVMNPGSTFSSEFFIEGEYEITCLLHPQMRGMVKVSYPDDHTPGSNLPPYARDDSAATPSNTSITLEVLRNDGDPEYSSVAIASVSPPAQGTVTVGDENRTITYVPNMDYVGEDTFDYTISDTSGAIVAATVTIEVGNHNPVAVKDTYSTHSNSPLEINPLSNDSDPDVDDALAVTRIMQYSYEPYYNIGIAGNGTISVTGQSWFYYMISDGRRGESVAEVNVFVYPTPSPTPRTVEFSAHWHDTPGAGSGTPTTEDCITPSCPPVEGKAHKSEEGQVTGSWMIHLPRGAQCGESGPLSELTTDGSTFELRGTYQGSCDLTQRGTPVVVKGECGPDSEISFKFGDEPEWKFIGESACGPVEQQPPANGGEGEETGPFCGRTEDDFDNVKFGTNDSETMWGTEEDDLIRGWGGNDTIYGLGGNDCLKGDDGDDTIWGGDGDDYLRGGEGDDKLMGDAGEDIVNGHAGNDKVWGGDGNDTLLGETGNDRLIGDSGDDTIWGGDDDDKILGEEGNDVAYGDGGNDRMYGQDGDDQLGGGAGEDTMVGGLGKDSLVGDLGNDRMWGNAGNDRLYDDEGDDYHNGGADVDKCYDVVGTNTFVDCEDSGGAVKTSSVGFKQYTVEIAPGHHDGVDSLLYCTDAPMAPTLGPQLAFSGVKEGQWMMWTEEGAAAGDGGTISDVQVLNGTVEGDGSKFKIEGIWTTGLGDKTLHCDKPIPASVTIEGQCGSNVTVVLAASNGIKAFFKGDVSCKA